MWGVCAWILFSLHSSRNTCNETYRHDRTVTINNHQLSAQVAETPQERESGLSGKACIANNQAMLFIFDKPDNYPFWMRDMKFSLDIVWVSPDKKIIEIQKNIAPQTYPESFVNSNPAKYVMEVAAGEADVLNLQTGDQISY